MHVISHQRASMQVRALARQQFARSMQVGTATLVGKEANPAVLAAPYEVPRHTAGVDAGTSRRGIYFGSFSEKSEPKKSSRRPFFSRITWSAPVLPTAYRLDSP